MRRNGESETEEGSEDVCLLLYCICTGIQYTVETFMLATVASNWDLEQWNLGQLKVPANIAEKCA